jgi:hypothetical protein
MGIDISKEVETRLTDQARKLGISVEDLLTQLINEKSRGGVAATRPTAPLPVWHLGAVGPLHRREAAYRRDIL